MISLRTGIYGMALAVALTVLIPLKGIQADDCQTACTEYVRCAGVIAQRQLTPQERAQGNSGCLRSCGTHKGAALGCYRQMRQSGNSCPVYAQCLMKAFNVQPNRPVPSR